MKLRFECLDKEFKLKNQPSLNCTRDGVTVNSFSVTVEGGLGLEEGQELSGNFAWLSDDDFELRAFAVEDFNHYDLNEVKSYYQHQYTEDPETGEMVPDEVPEDFVPEVLSTSLYFTTSERIPPSPPPEPFIPDPAQVLAEEKARRKVQIPEMMDQCITMGIDVQTEFGLEHFSLREKDKTMLLGIYAMVQSGLTQFPYHSLGAEDSTNICVVYSDADIGKIATAAFAFITFHESYANMLQQWLQRAETIEEVYTIHYGADLPEDLQLYLEMVMVSAAGNDEEAMLGMIPANMPLKGSDIKLPTIVQDPNMIDPNTGLPYGQVG